MEGEVWKYGVPRYVVLCICYFLGVRDCSDTRNLHDYLYVCVCVWVDGNRCAYEVHTSLGHVDALVSFHSLDYFSLKYTCEQPDVLDCSNNTNTNQLSFEILR